MQRTTRPVAALAVVLTVLLSACATMSRPPETDAERAERKRREDQACVDFFLAAHDRLRERMVHDAEADQTFDVLILSGGGDFGAFGAGFLLGWGECTDPSIRRPEFDFVAGTSTGAILAPLAFIGTDSALEVGARLYSDPPPNLVKEPGLLSLLPWNAALSDPSGLRKTVHDQLDADFLAELRRGDDEKRILACASTNIDFGTFRPFNLLLGRNLPDEQYREFLVERIMASAAIPGVFPPVLIDGSLFVDGGATENAWTLRDQSVDDSAISQWLRRFPDRPLPKMRLWYLVNNQLFPPGETVDPTWINLAGRGLSTAIRSALIKDLLIGSQVARLTNEHLAKISGGRISGEVEFRFVAIPDDFVPPVPGNFKPETMRALVELGERMGRDPSSWRTEVPHLDGVGGWKPYEGDLVRPDGSAFVPRR
jgi:hypothetical protein